jgi:TolB protein
VSEASLRVLHNSGGTWGSPSALVVANNDNNYYPSYSPDGQWVVFNRASIGTTASGDAKSSYDALDATPWVVSAAGGVPPVPLKRATSPYGDSWPKWMQREQKHRGKKLMWLTFSSRRAYGLRASAGANAQIWMVAFDPEAAAQGKDPSSSAFWLPFQELSTGNHIAQWVTRVARKDCTDQNQCEAGEQCIKGVCRPAVK